MSSDPAAPTPAHEASATQARVEAALAPLRARVRGHGGDVTVASVDAGVAQIEFHGACHACPAISLTFSAAVAACRDAYGDDLRLAARQVHVSAAALDRMAALARRGPAQTSD